MTNTPNYNLKKPSNSDYYDIEDQNGNMNIIDDVMKSTQQRAMGTNLLHNSDFKVSQRGSVVELVNGFFVDRWFSWSTTNSKWEQDPRGLKMTNLDNTNMMQCIEGTTGRTYESLIFTVTLEGIQNNMVGGVIIQVNDKRSGYTHGRVLNQKYCRHPNNGEIITHELKVENVTLTDFLAANIYMVNDTTGAQSVIIKNAKLELGTVATPFERPDPCLELLKCQRYLQYLDRDDIHELDLTPTMRINPVRTYVSENKYMYNAEL